jgi:hypothetical protein
MYLLAWRCAIFITCCAWVPEFGLQIKALLCILLKRRGWVLPARRYWLGIRLRDTTAAADNDTS